MNTTDHPTRMSLTIGLFLLLVLALFDAHAADQIWTGAGSDARWRTPGNWQGGVPPSSGDSLIFTGTSGLDNTNNFLTGSSFGGVTFQSPAGAFTLNGKSITLNGNITNNQVVTEQILRLSLILGVTPILDVTQNGILTLNGVVSGSYGLTKVDGGLLNLNADNTFSGPLTVDGGAVTVGSDANLGAGPVSMTPGAITLNGGALEATASFTVDANRGIAVGSGADGFGILTVEPGHTLTYGGVIAGAGSLVKNGYGNLTLSGQNAYTGATSNRVGALTLDFSQTGAPVDNIIPAGSDLTLGGENAGAGLENEAQLNVVGRDSTVNAQSFNSTHVTFGGSVVQTTSGSGGTVDLHLGALSHDPGGALLFLPPEVTGGGGNITTTSGNINGILGGWATIGDGTSYSSHGAHVYYSTNFAAVDASGNITNFMDYLVYNSGNLAGQVNVSDNLLFAPSGPQVITVDNANAGTTTEVNAINISAPDTGSTANYYGIYIGQGNTLRLGKYGGILKTDRSRDVITIGGLDGSVQSGNGTSGSGNIGTLTAGGADNSPGEIVMTSDAGDESHGTTIFECRITDNGTGKVAFIKMGPGSIKLDGDNTFSGGLYLLQGRVQTEAHEINNTLPDGSNATGVGRGPVYILPGAYFFGDATYTNDFYIAGEGDAAEYLGAIRDGTFNGPIHLIGDARLTGGTFNGPITGPFNLSMGAPSTYHGSVELSNPSNDWTGDTIMNATDHHSDNQSVTYGADNVIPHGFGHGNVFMEGSTGAGLITWNLNGFNATINGLSTRGSNPHDAIIDNGAGSTTSTLTLGDNNQSGTFAGALQDGSGILALTKIGGGVETLTGTNTYSGDTTVSGGSLALKGSGSISASTHTIVQDGGVLDGSAQASFNYPNTLSLTNGILKVSSGATVGTLDMSGGRLRVTTLGGTPNVTANSLNLGGGTNLIDIVSLGQITHYPIEITVLKYTGSLTGPFNFGLGNLPSVTTTGYVSNNVANSSVDVVLLTGPALLTWTGANGNAWDVGTSTNWLAFGTTPSVFHNVDAVNFLDGASTGTVSVNGPVAPGSIEVNNSSLNYTFVGISGIDGLASMTKDGTGTLILDNGDNTFSGGLTINSGTVQVGNNDANGTLPAVGGVDNDGSLVFDRTDSLTVSAPITGSGLITQNSGLLTLSGNNSFTGAVIVNQGTLQAGSGTALGTGDGSTTINSGATLDVNGQTLDTEPVVVSGNGVGGNGAIVNSANGQSLNAMGDLTLAGDTSLGGNGGRWDIRGGAATLSTSGNPYTLNKIGTNYVAIVGVNVDSALGDINVMGGTLSIETSTSGLGDSSHTLTVASGATLQFYATTASFYKQFVLNGNGVTATLNCASGTANTISGPISLNGNCVFNTGTGDAITFSGSLGGSGSLIKTGAGTNILASGAAATYSGDTTISSGTFVVDGTLSGAVIVQGGATLQGLGSAGGLVTVAGGDVSPGSDYTAVGTLTVGSLALNNGTATFQLSNTPGSGNDQLTVSGGLTLTGINTLQIVPLSFMNVGDEYTLIQYSGATLPSNATNNLVVTSATAGFTFAVVDPSTTPGSIKIRVLSALGNDFWTGAQSPVWDHTTANWSRSGNAVSFNDGDYATFDDSSSVTNVVLSGKLKVSGMTVSSSSEAYHFGGIGSLTGAGGLHLSGVGLTIANHGTNDFGGPITIDYGILQIGEGSTNGSLGVGAMTNNGALVFDRSDNGLAISNVIAGSGSMTNKGPGMVTLTGANTFDGEVDILQGTLRTLNSAALGDTYGETVVSNGATLDIGANNVNLSQEYINVEGAGVGGNGAIVNSSGSPTFVGPNIGQVVMNGDTTIGGSGRIDFRASSASAADVVLYTGGQPYTLTKVGTNQFQLAGVQIDPGLGNIDVLGGTIGFQWQIPYMGDPGYALHLHPGTTLNLFDLSNALDKVLILDDGSTVYNQHGTNIYSGPVTLNGMATFDTAYGLTLTGTIGGSGGLLKTGDSTLLLATGPASYTGDTYVNGGTLVLSDGVELTNTPVIVLSNATIDVSGRTDGTFSLGDVISQTLAGGGSINGNLTVKGGSVVNPGNGVAPAILTVTNGTATLNGGIVMDLNRAAGAVTNDEIVASSLAVGGVLTVTNLGPDLVTGDRFQLFSNPVSGFAQVNLPSHNAAGTVTYQWQNDLSTDGSVIVTSGATGVNMNPTNIMVSVSGGNLTISWPVNHQGWTLQSQTNAPGAGLGTNWVDVPGSTATDSMTIPLSSENGSVFYRLILKP